MAQKCVICKEKIQEIFLGKILGTIINKKSVCSKCQKEHGKNLASKL